MTTDRWYPTSGRPPHNPPEPGTLIAYDRKLYRVMAIHERHPANWDKHDTDRLRNEQAWHANPKRERAKFRHDWDGRAETWPERPRAIEIISADGGIREHWRWPQRAWHLSIYVLPDHYPVCAECGEPYPCREIDAKQQAAHEMAHVEQLMTIPPGACWHCREPITSRQASTTFPGDNLLLPGAPPAAFHERHTKGCNAAARAYEKRWAAAAGTKDPSLFEEGT